ncbi:hypothetical protein PAHAL_3G290800 [Panicum hallii]|uniref:Uncharacterized protein n=1 Tax=Panicum hallii TaxID=206008 RepID=A0A2S3HCC5_9POAL|nr:hypothetical protein PAHAL_3G290800 [Panicum hallii]
MEKEKYASSYTGTTRANHDGRRRHRARAAPAADTSSGIRWCLVVEEREGIWWYLVARRATSRRRVAAAGNEQPAGGHAWWPKLHASAAGPLYIAHLRKRCLKQTPQRNTPTGRGGSPRLQSFCHLVPSTSGNKIKKHGKSSNG